MLEKRDFLKILDFSKEELRYLIDLSEEFKRKKHNNEPHEYLKGKNIVLLFEKDSTRTRCAFEVSAYDLGMNATYIGPTGSQMGKKESISDTGKVLSRMYDAIEYRGFSQSVVEELAKSSTVPVYNGLTDLSHPTQMLADFLTIKENFDEIRGLNFVFMGDARNNVARSLMIMCAKMGVNFTCVAPSSLFPDNELVETAKRIASLENSTITLTEDVNSGTKNANIIYTDVWVSMGEEESIWEERINLLKDYQVNKTIIENANENVIFLHCLPSFHDTNTTIGKKIYEKFGISEMEVTDEVFNSSYSKVFDQAENRLHTIKALIYATLK